MPDLMERVERAAGVEHDRPTEPATSPEPPLPYLAPAAASSSSPGGCVDRGLDTILSPGCLSRLGPLPASLPAAGPGAVGSGYPSPSPAELSPPPVGIGCTVNGSSSSHTFRAADAASCIRGAIAFIPQTGAVSILLLDQSGNAAAARCSIAVPGGRAICVGS